jgi:hypothetical protein
VSITTLEGVEVGGGDLKRTSGDFYSGLGNHFPGVVGLAPLVSSTASTGGICALTGG